MKKVMLIAVLVAAGGFAPSRCEAQPAGKTIPWPAGLPRYDHIVIVVEENRSYDEIFPADKSKPAPYITDVLKKEGANFTRMFAEEHPSEGNYFWLFSGSNQNVGNADHVPGTDKKGKVVIPHPLMTPNLAQSLFARGLSFKGYSESLPAIGYVEVGYGKSETRPTMPMYARKHVPWISFGNIPQGKTLTDSTNLRFKDFPTPDKFDMLPKVAFVIPNLDNDMHNGSILRGDNWLRDNLNAYYQWAKKNNSLLIVTWDEGEDEPPAFRALTNPFVQPFDKTKQMDRNKLNQIPTIIAGAHIKAGDYTEGKGVTHVNILRTIESMYGLPKVGAQQKNAVLGGISDDYIITDVFEKVK